MRKVIEVYAARGDRRARDSSDAVHSYRFRAGLERLLQGTDEVVAHLPD